MLKTIKRIAIGASMVVGASAIATAPAVAGSLTGATIGGSAPSDYYVYDVSGNQTVKVNSTLANVQKVLDGNAGSPTGNVELRATSEQAGFDFTKNTTLTGNIGGSSITLSSLTASDWNTTVTGGLSLAKTWFNAALTANGFGSLFSNAFLYGTAWNKFITGGGLERFSDPNISYVNQNDSTGLISIGLAGHYDATNLLFSSLTSQEKALVNLLRDPSKAGSPIQASELVKYTYNGKTDYLYSFLATNSGLKAADDGISHTGNYEVTLAGVPPTSVPEPSTMLGLMTVGGMVVASKRKSQKPA